MIMQNFFVDFKELAEGLYLSTSYSSYFLKLSGFLMGRKPFLKMMELLKDPIFASYPKEIEFHLEKTTKLTVFLTKLYIMICTCVVLSSASIFFVDGTLPMPVPINFGKYLVLAYIVEMTAMVIAVWNNLCLDTLCASLMGLAAGQLDILKNKIEICNEIALKKIEIFENDDNDDILMVVQEEVIRLLKNCIQHHSKIILYVNLIEKVFSFSILIQLMGSIIVICNTGFFLLIITPFSAQFFMLVVYFITMMSQLSLYCWFGNEIIIKSVEIGGACYLSKWYMCDNRVRKLLFITMERSKRPLEITACKFTNLSLITFSTIIRWSYSYFTLLQRLAAKMNLL
nr:odorant receptor 67c-like [Onthophagus taurus]